MELHQHLIGISYIKPQADCDKYFDLSDEKRISIEGYAFPFNQKACKYNKQQSVLITTVTEPAVLKQMQQLCKQYNTFNIVSTDEDPTLFKGHSVISKLPE